MQSPTFSILHLLSPILIPLRVLRELRGAVFFPDHLSRFSVSRQLVHFIASTFPGIGNCNSRIAGPSVFP